MRQSDIEKRVLEATRRYLAERAGEDPTAVSAALDDAVCQDLMILGVDVEDYVWALETEFGDVVWTIPWLHYTDQTNSFRGCGCLMVPPWLVWRLMKKLVRGGTVMDCPHPRDHPHRLTLREVAAAIEAGGWPKDWRPE